MGTFGPALLAISAVLLFAAGPGEASGSAAHGEEIRYSKGFSIEEKPGFEILKVLSPWPGARRGFSYVLYPRGSPKPSGIEADGFFEVPLRRVVVLSTTYIPMIVELGCADSLVGVDSAASVSSPEARSRIASGKTVEAARNGEPDIERMIALKPDAIFAYGMGNEWDVHPKLAEAGLPVILGGEWNEEDPLARAEWLKFVAAFYGRAGAARELFDGVAAEYGRVKALAAATKERPRVLVNGPFQGTWTVAGGKSYMARFLADAGASYLWSDDGSPGGATLSLEAVYQRALKADIWLNPGLGIGTKAELVAADPRFAALPAVAAGRVWNNDLRRSPGGGSDYFESGVIHPEKVLVDLVKIFHPGLLQDRGFTYYRNVGK